MTRQKTWILCLSLAVLAWLILSPAAAQDAKPVAVFTESQHDFGTVDRGDKLEYTFKVRNDGTVDVRFFVDAGKRAYVRRISFAGNAVTQDEVLRREMRQIEGGWASTSLIDLSKVRLERLGYFQDVAIETPEVPGSDDQIDVDFNVTEQPSGSISATLGFAQSSGLILGGSYQENNVLGIILRNRFQQALGNRQGWLAPGGPEAQDDYSIPLCRQFDLAAVERIQLEIGRLIVNGNLGVRNRSPGKDLLNGGAQSLL